MKARSIAVTLIVVGALAGCGGGGNGSSNAINLTQAQARQVGTTVSNDVSKALASAVGNPAVPLDITTRNNMLVALQRNNGQANAVSTPEDVTCTGSNCTVSGTYNCPDGTLVINGNPDVTVTVQGSDNGVTTTVNLKIGGGVSFSPVQAGQFPTGSCSFDVTASVSVNDSSGSVTSSSISGSICGQAIN